MSTTVSIASATEPGIVLQKPSTGEVWDTVAAVWDAAPGAGAYASEYLLAVTQNGGTKTWRATVPSAAGAEWQLLIYALAAPNAEDTVQELKLPPSYCQAPAEQEVVPDSRTSQLTWLENFGLVSEETREIIYGKRQLVAVDFKNDLHTNGVLKSIGAVAKQSGAGAATIEVAGIDHTKAKIYLTGTTAGEFILSVPVVYKGSDHEAEADVTYRVVGAP